MIKNIFRNSLFRTILIINCQFLTTTYASAQAIVNDPVVKGEENEQWYDRLIQEIEQWIGIEATLEKTTDIYDQGKEWYDSLKEVKQSIERYQKIGETIQLVFDIKDIILINLQRIRADPNFTSAEIIQIAKGYTNIANEGIKLIDELTMSATATDLSLTDKDRYDLINTVYKKVKEYKSLVQYYTRKNISVSYMRSKKKNNQDRVLQLYGR
jgi:hypothetical protein